MDFNLAGQIALVTGAGRGLGRIYAQSLAAAGAKVVVSARSEGEIAETATRIKQAGGTALAIPVDVTDPIAVERMMQQIEGEFGRIDLLINNAGVITPLGPIWESDPLDWKNAIDVNLYGCYLCARAALKRMISRGSGRIISIASGASLAPLAYASAYCVSKAALARLTEQIALEAKDYGISAFALDPGTVLDGGMPTYIMEWEAGTTYTPWFTEAVLAGAHVPADLSIRLIGLMASGKVDALSGRFIGVWMDVNEMIKSAEQITKADLYTLRLNSLPAEPDAGDT
jgi:NAD(P)-dependent dehydrogenase (short-subunit alcohol dehydrogenase family)